MSKVNFELGQEVVIKGKFINQEAVITDIEESKKRIEQTGKPEISIKYGVETFDEPKVGIVVGVRNIVGSRIHYYNGESVQTKTLRQPAIVVACNLRGQFLAPVSMVQDYWEWDLEIDEKLSQEARYNLEL